MTAASNVRNMGHFLALARCGAARPASSAVSSGSVRSFWRILLLLSMQWRHGLMYGGHEYTITARSSAHWQSQALQLQPLLLVSYGAS